MDRRSEVLNEALAIEVRRNVSRREAVGSAAGESAVPQELKDMSIPPDSDPKNVQRKQRQKLRAAAARRRKAAVQLHRRRHS